MWVNRCGDYKVGKSANQIPNPSSCSPSTFHDPNSMEEILDCLMKPTVNTKSFIWQHDVTIHNLCLEYELGFCYTLSFIGHDSLYHDPHEKSIPVAIFPHSLDFHIFGSNCDRIQSSHIT